MNNFAIYRLPYANEYTLVAQEVGVPLELPSCAALGDCEGFVFAPFSVSPREPVLLLRPDRVESFPCPEEKPVEGIAWQSGPLLAARQQYHIDFANFHAQLQNGQFRKIVLSRRVEEVADGQLDPMNLFARACHSYPRMFVALVSTQQGGTWLMATPEVLLEGSGSHWRTVALAGTMPFAESVDWSEKNLREQRYVASYVMECLEHFSGHVHEEGPRTVRAAHLAHLQSDFTFTLKDARQLGQLLQALHPTPAVCGLPKEKAFDFIRHNESAPRRYYSGFCGPLSLGGNTHLFVSLRCMDIRDNRFALYAGGGLLEDSEEQMEWEETEAKLNIMRHVLR